VGNGASGANGQAHANGWGSAKPLVEERDQPSLTPESSDYDRGFCIDWMRGFNALVVQNADSPEGRNFDAEQNATLGKILTSMSNYAQE
jgi:hypothetical protein